MQMRFDFGGNAEISDIRDRLVLVFGGYTDGPRLDPISQLVKSLISSRTRDAVSLRAYERLIHRYWRWSHMTAAPPEELEEAIADVTFADVKARRLARALKEIAARNPDFVLDFLRDWPVEPALAWLERLPGVARKVAAATLNFSTLRRPAFVVDTHVLRVLRRLGFIAPTGTTTNAYHFVMNATEGWTADDLTYLHTLLKRLGQVYCRAIDPLCSDCPIGQSCRHGPVDVSQG